MDVCSVLGGKISYIVLYLIIGVVIVLDLYDYKLELVMENVKCLGLLDKIKIKKLDVSKVYEYFFEDIFDKILVDVFCLGIGLICCKLDIKYNKVN